MDLVMDADEQELVRAVNQALRRHAGPERAREVDDLDEGLVKELEAAGFLDVATAEGGSLLRAVFVVEEAEAAAARAPVAARALVAPMVAPECAGRTVGLVGGRRGALVRYGRACDVYLVLDGESALLCEPSEVTVESAETRWGYPMARVECTGGTDLGPGSGARLRRYWRLALAVEAGAAMLAAVTLTSRYVSERIQFGRPIGSFQAVQHRLAHALVFAEGTQWLAREAAWFHEDDARVAAAATFATQASTHVFEHTHQVTGAIGITKEYDLSLWTSRLPVLQQELGGTKVHARTAARARWAG